ncbi:GNAT family protein [Amaricoccus sp.]|uniref:GNAT family N-acetyltransferase n=1 Tax=Amaricoccus sp. TaxID=1872485 RepID=UPI001B6D5068|nr:GNAT family protein [Amaricoccus sp.]MBP7000438.1 GNAT family N-acetyltransferase [Amaricoccus sp.]
MATLANPRPELVTARLRLRPLDRADAGLIHLYASDARVAAMTTSIPHPYPPGSAEALVARAVAGERETVWALDTGGENGLIGLISAKPAGEGVVELGYWVAPAFWNAGFAGEAIEAVAAELLRDGAVALTAEVFQDNLASARVLTRAGFAYEGEGETHSVARAAMVPTFRYRLALG